MIGGLVLLALLAFAALGTIALYNGLVSRRNGYKNAFSQIDVQLKRRHSLIPNLVETAKAYMKHERQTLEAVIAARNVATTVAQRAAASPGEPGAMKDLAGAESALSGALSRLVAVVESYPALRANENMARLMEELSSTENRIAFARQAYNDSVMAYNVARESFPGTLVASSFGFREAAPYECASEPERSEVKVSFG